MPDDWATLAGVDLHLALDGTSGRRVALEQALRQAIRDGRLAPQARLPSTRALAGQLGLARNTVAAAYDQLVAEGYLSARTGSGTVVASLPARAPAPSPDAGPHEGPTHDLRPGSPDVTTFPVSAWLRASRRALAAAHPSTFDYQDPRGSLVLRTQLAEYLGRTRGVLAHPDRIAVTSGFVQALSLLTSVVGGPVAMEDPTLAGHREVVRRAGGAIVPLAVDAWGARTDRLTDRVAAVVLTAAHQYPTGVPLHPRRRRAATAWAQERDGLVIEDDYDGEFRYDRQPVGALQGMAPDRVAYIGTASKTLGPALRLGWVVLPDRWVEPFAEAKRHLDRHTEVIGQLTFAELIRGHDYDRHVRACRLRYRRRRDQLVARLAGWPVHGIAAGLHALVSLPPGGPTEADVLALAEERGVRLSGLAGHWHDPGDHPQGIIVGYGKPSAAAYPAALEALATLLAQLSPPAGTPRPRGRR